MLCYSFPSQVGQSYYLNKRFIMMLKNSVELLQQVLGCYSHMLVWLVSIEDGFRMPLPIKALWTLPMYMNIMLMVHHTNGILHEVVPNHNLLENTFYWVVSLVYWLLGNTNTGCFCWKLGRYGASFSIYTIEIEPPHRASHWIEGRFRISSSVRSIELAEEILAQDEKCYLRWWNGYW